MRIGIRRYILYLNRVLPPEVSKEGEKPFLIEKGDYPIFDSFRVDILKIHDDTKVFFYHTSSLIRPIEFIGGRDMRPPGDTCRMFYKIKQEGFVAKYFFWDGIVPEGVSMLGEKHYNENFGLATGLMDYRMVLLEKTKKAPSFFEGALKNKL